MRGPSLPVLLSPRCTRGCRSLAEHGPFLCHNLKTVAELCHLSTVQFQVFLITAINCISAKDMRIEDQAWVIQQRI